MKRRIRCAWLKRCEEESLRRLQVEGGLTPYGLTKIVGVSDYKLAKLERGEFRGIATGDEPDATEFSMAADELRKMLLVEARERAALSLSAARVEEASEALRQADQRRRGEESI